MLRNAGRWNVFAAQVTSESLAISNPLAGRLVAENKLCLAVMSESRLRRLLTAPQRQALDALIP